MLAFKAELKLKNFNIRVDLCVHLIHFYIAIKFFNWFNLAFAASVTIDGAVFLFWNLKKIYFDKQYPDSKNFGGQWEGIRVNKHCVRDGAAYPFAPVGGVAYGSVLINL